MSPTAIRPTGKPYTRRKPPEAHLCYDNFASPAQVIVTRTADPDEAHRVALRELEHLAYVHDSPVLTPDDGYLAWLRLVPFDPSGHLDSCWLDDPVRGVPCIVWDYGEPA